MNKLIKMIFLSVIIIANFANVNATVTGLYNTGKNTTFIQVGNSFPIADQSWSITAAPDPMYLGTVIVPGVGYPSWVDYINNPSQPSRWIVPLVTPQPNAQSALPGNYTFTTTFSTDNPINMSFVYSVDNLLAGVQLIGPTNYEKLDFPGYSFTEYSPPFSINNIQPGTYTMNFIVFNSPLGSPDPTGLRVQFSTQDIIAPEPTTYASLGAMLFFGLLAHRRKSLLKAKKA